MSLSERASDLLNSLSHRDADLNRFADWMKEEYGQNLGFCSLFGNRWSFRAGTQESPAGSIRRELNGGWGLVTDEIKIPEDEWESLCSSLADWLPHR